MSVTIGDTAVTIAFVALLIAGSAATFLVYEGWNTMYPDERELSREYAFEGTYDGMPCTGSGTSEHIGFRGGYRLYTLSISMESGDVRDSASLNLIFDDKDSLDTTLYTLVGEEDLDGKRVTVWTRTENDVDYTLFVSEGCTLESIAMSSPHFRLTGSVI